jgi:hypothetical protein
MKAHRGLSDDQARRLDVTLVLLLANRIADAAVLHACIDTARTVALSREGS